MTRRGGRAVATSVLTVVVLASPAGAIVPLTMRQARYATRVAAGYLGDLIDAKIVRVGTCHRLRADRIDCRARVHGAQQTCSLRVAVIRVPGTYVAHGRDVRCELPQRG